MTDKGRTTIWYLIGSLQVGGANRTLVDLANGLDPDRYDVTIWTILTENPLAEDLDDAITHRSLDACGKYDLSAVVRFCRMTRCHCPDILQSFLFFDNTLARLAGVLSSVPIVSGVRAVPTQPSRLRTTVDRFTIGVVTRVVSNSEAGRNLAIDRGAPPDQVSVIPNGRDIETFASATPVSDLRESLNIPSDARLVGTVGRLIRRKGHFDLLDAWVTVRADHPDTHLLMIGDGLAREPLDVRAASADVADSVHFLGFRDDVPALLSMLDLFVFPSHFEGLPGALIEAMASGLPIVATDAVGNDELITDEETGLLVPVEDPDALGAVMTDVLADETLANRLSVRAQQVASEQYSIERMVSEFSELYERLA